MKGKAQETTSLNECKQKALAHNKTIKAKEANYKASEAEVKLSKIASLPNLDFDASYLYQNDPMQMHIPGYELPTVDGNPSGVYSPESTSNLQYHNSYNANMGISLPLYLGGKLAEARKISQYATEIAASDLALSQTDVLLSIEQQYWSLVLLIESDKAIAKSIYFLSDVVNDMENRYQEGIVTKNEVLKAKVELNNAKLYQISISNNIKLSKMAMNQSIGVSIDEPLNVADTSIEVAMEVDLFDFNEQLLDSRNELTILQKQNEIAQSEKALVISDYRPQLASFANYYYQNPNHLAKAEGELTWNAGISLSIPIYHWGERKLKKAKAEMKIASAGYALDQTKELLTLEVHQAIFKLKESMIKLQFTVEALEQSEENLSLENNRLKEEISTTTDLLNAQMQWQKAKADHISAKANVKISEALYKKSIGALNP
jgi:outer membrane protein TolC